MKIDVLIPAYNAEHTIRACLNSLMVQSHQDFRVIIYDDGSTDNTQSVAVSYKDKLPKLVYLKGKDNVGIGYARNILLQAASADYCIWQDADDIAHPKRLEKMLFGITQAKVDVLFSDIRIFSEKKDLQRLSINLKKDAKKDSLHNNLVGRTGIFTWDVTNIDFDEKAKTNKESFTDWIIRCILFKRKFGHIPEVLYRQRKEEEQTHGN